MTSVLRSTADLAYRMGLGPRPSDVPDHRLVELVEGAGAVQPGRALDLGCGTGRNALYLARHGWESTGVEMSGHAVRTARRKAEAAGLRVRFVQGDVTALSGLGIGDDYRLLMDGGCYHMIPAARRDGYARGVTEAAAPGALLIMVGFPSRWSLGIRREELVERFPGWELITADRVPAEQMREYVSGPAPLRALLGRGAFHPMRYQLRRRAS